MHQRALYRKKWGAKDGRREGGGRKWEIIWGEIRQKFVTSDRAQGGEGGELKESVEWDGFCICSLCGWGCGQC